MSWDNMQRIRTPAGWVEYAEQGEGPPVVFLHGLLMNHTQWDAVLPLLPTGFRYLRPALPLGGHRLPFDGGADLSLPGMVRVVADLLEALDLEGVTLVHSDWGGGLFLTAHGLDQRVGRQVLFPCEAFENFPPGLPGRMAAVAVRMPAGISLAARQLRRKRLRRLPFLFGWMAKYPLADELVAGWTEHAIADRDVRRDLRRYGRTRFDRVTLIRDTEGLSRFHGAALVLWSKEDRVMPREHGRRLADLLPNGRLVEVDDAYVLSMLDQPQTVARELSAFLIEDLPSTV